MSNDPQQRFRDHHGPKGSRSVKMHGGPKTLRWTSQKMERGAALSLEAKIKKLARQRKEQIIKGSFDPLGLMS